MGIVGILLIVLGILLIAVAAWYFKDNISSYFSTNSMVENQEIPPTMITTTTIPIQEKSADNIVSKKDVSAKKEDDRVPVINPPQQIVLNVQVFQQLANEPFHDKNNIITKSNQFIMSCNDRFTYIPQFDISECTIEVMLQGLCYYHSKLREVIKSSLFILIQQDSPFGDYMYHGDIEEYISKVPSYEDQCNQCKVMITTYNTIRAYQPVYEWSSKKSLFQQKCDVLDLLKGIDEATWVKIEANSMLSFYIKDIKFNPTWKERTSYIDDILLQLKMNSWEQCRARYQDDKKARIRQMKNWFDDIRNMEEIKSTTTTNDIIPSLKNYCELKAIYEEKFDDRMIPVCKYILQQQRICNQTGLFDKVQKVANVSWTKDILELLRMRKWEDIMKEFQKQEEYCKRYDPTATTNTFDELVNTITKVEEKRTAALQQTRVKKLTDFATYLGIYNEGASVDSLVEAILKKMFNNKIPNDIAPEERMRYIMINMIRYKLYQDYTQNFHENVKHLRVLFWLNEEATEQQRSILLRPITNFNDMNTYTQYFQQLLSAPNAKLTRENIIKAIQFRAASVLSKITNTLSGLEYMEAENVDIQKLIKIKTDLTRPYTKDSPTYELQTLWAAPLERIRSIKLVYEENQRHKNNDEGKRLGFSKLYQQYQAFFQIKSQNTTTGFLSSLFRIGNNDSENVTPDSLFSLTECISHWISSLDFKLMKNWKPIADQTSPSEAEIIINQQIVTAINTYITQIPTNQGAYSWNLLVTQTRQMKETIGDFFGEKDVIRVRDKQIERARELKIEGTLHDPSWTYFGEISKWNEMPTTKSCSDEGSCICMYHIILMKERVTTQEKIISDDLIKTFQTILSHNKQHLITWTQSADDLQEYRLFDVPEEVEQIPKVITPIIQIALPRFSLLDANIMSNLENEYYQRLEKEISSYREVFTWFGVTTLPRTFKELCEFLSRYTQAYHSKLNLETLREYYITWQKNKIKSLVKHYFIECQYKLGSSRELEEQVKDISNQIESRSKEIQVCYKTLKEEAGSLVAETSKAYNDDDLCQVIMQASKKLCSIGICHMDPNDKRGDSIQLFKSFMNNFRQLITTYIQDNKGWIQWCGKSLKESWNNIQQLLLIANVCKDIYEKETSQTERIKQNWEPLKSFPVTTTIQFQQLKTKCHQWQHIQEVCNLLQIKLCEEVQLWRVLKTRIKHLKTLSDHFFRFIHEDLENAKEVFADSNKTIPTITTMKNYATYLTNYENSFRSRGFTKKRMEMNIQVLQYVEQIKTDFNQFKDQFSTASSSLLTNLGLSQSGPIVDLRRYINRFSIHELINDQSETNPDKMLLEYNESNLLQFSSLLTSTLRTIINPKSLDVPSSIFQWSTWYHELIKQTRFALINFLNYNPKSLSSIIPVSSNESFTTLWQQTQERITFWCKTNSIKQWDISQLSPNLSFVT